MIQIPAELQAEISRMMSNGRYESEAELLRSALSALQTQNDDLAAVEAGLADLQAGRIHPLAQVEAEIRAKHGWTKSP